MLTFRIRFLKDVSDATGHEHRICQRCVEVEARDPVDALAMAAGRFCDLERIPEWSFRADAIELERLKGRARAAA